MIDHIYIRDHQNMIKPLRQALGLNQADLASLTRCRQSVVSRVENGTHAIRDDTAVRFAEAFAVASAARSEFWAALYEIGDQRNKWDIESSSLYHTRWRLETLRIWIAQYDLAPPPFDL